MEASVESLMIIGRKDFESHQSMEKDEGAYTHLPLQG
jgi:hypothetical protein